MNSGDLNRYYAYYTQTSKIRAARPAGSALDATPPPKVYSKAETRAVALAANIAKDGLRVLGEGDSWFDFPLGVLFDPVSDLLDALIHEHGYVVDRLAHRGDTVGNMSSRANLAIIHQHLTALPKDAFLFSGGGNDLCQKRSDGSSEFYDVLTSPPAKHGIQAKILKGYLDQVLLGYKLVLEVAAAAKVPAFVHSYAHAIPSGIPALYKYAGPWLRPQLVSKQYNPDTEGPALVAKMIDGLSTRLESMANRSRGNVHFVDLRPVIGPDDWHDELHLLPNGWRKAGVVLNDSIRKALGK